MTEITNRTLSIDSRLTIEACEKFLFRLYDISAFLEMSRQSTEDSLAGDFDTAVKISTNFSNSIGGGEASFLQAVMTWARSQTTPKLLTYIKDPSDIQIEKLASSLLGLASILTADSVNSIDKSHELKGEARNYAIRRLKVLQNRHPRESTKGPQVHLMCCDHLGFERPRLLYPKQFEKDDVRPRQDFLSVARILLLASLADLDRVDWTDDAIESIGEMLYELFKNTHDHARHDLDRNRLMHSYRGLQTKFIAQKKEQLLLMSSGYEPLKSYFDCFKPKYSKEQVSFFELSVFDTGVGFAQSFTRLPLTSMGLAEELHIVNECFRLGSTQKRSIGKGRGLSLVLEFLNRNHGFLRLRTGRMSLFYDSLRASDASGAILRQYITDSQMFMPPTVGSVVTIIVPIDAVLTGEEFQ